ncbi:MAG: NAD(+) diphosphatase [Photobacterium frigidiphilum]|uniref:NAD(+) diphosphatase n=1 Tax=Photobacterium frigidiphilum TaxID=264736 RepID=UPI0030015282
MLNKRELAYWCVVNDRKLYLLDNAIPLLEKSELTFNTDSARVIGEYLDHPVYWLEANNCLHSDDFYTQRELLGIDQALFDLAGRATQLSHMLHTQSFCSVCGGAAVLAGDQFAMVCQQCSNAQYPRVSPCIIVAVRKEDQILLAQHPRHKTGIYTVIAGFVEAGETLEQCVAREVEEETGIQVKNIRYFSSQPWAFPSNIMMAFLADYESGEINPDYEELSDAIWAKAADLPAIAPKGTIARVLIDETLDLIKATKHIQNL